MKIHNLVVLQIVQALVDIFENHYYPDKTIERAFKKNIKWGARDRRFFAEGVYEILRHRRFFEELLQRIFKKPFSSKEEHYKILFWIYWIYSHEDLPEKLDLNPLLISQLNKELLKKTELEITDPAVRHSFPDWFYEFGKKELGKDWPAWSVYLNQQAPVILRVNLLKTTPENLKQAFQLENIQVRTFDPETPWVLELIQRQNLFASPLFKQGFFEIQDASSQLVAPLLELNSTSESPKSWRCVDSCAGAGGKSLHMAVLMQNKGKLISLDLYEHKLEELQKRARRNGIHIIETRVIESTKTIKRLAESADRVLLDVPCTGSGVLRRNPDTKWKLSMEEINRLKNLQKEILKDYSKMTKVGGHLVYATCSILPSENQDQIQWFLNQEPGKWELQEEVIMSPPTSEIPYAHYFKKSSPEPHKASDGFYAASLKRLS